MMLCLDEHFEEIDRPFAVYHEGSESARHLLSAACKEGHAPAMYFFGLECDEPEEKKKWLHEAARKGYSPAMYAYALVCEDRDAKIRWLRKAALEGHIGAVHALARECQYSRKRRMWRLIATECEFGQSAVESTVICENLDDKERWLLEADRNGWQPSFLAG